MTALMGATLLAAFLAPAAAQAAPKYNPDIWVTYSGNYSAGYGVSCSNADYNDIQDAVSNANNGDVIHICPGWWDLNNDINSYHETITLEGEGPGKTRIDMNGDDRFFNGYEDNDPWIVNDVVIRGIAVYNGDSAFGSAVLANHVTCENSYFMNNWAYDDGGWDEEGGGGAILAYNGYSGNGCKFYYNNAENWGGAVLVWGGPFYSVNETYVGNGKYCYDYDLTDCGYDPGNVEYGGAIAQYGDGAFNMVKGNLALNFSWNDGGAIYTDADYSFTVTNTTFKDNWSDDHGGAIYSSADETVKITNNKFISNAADGDGGAVLIDGDANVVWLTGNYFLRNDAWGYGGAFGNWANDLYMRANKFEWNWSDDDSDTSAFFAECNSVVWDWWSKPSWGAGTGSIWGSNKYGPNQNYDDDWDC